MIQLLPLQRYGCGGILFQEFFGGALEDELAAAVAGVRTELYDVVGGADDVQIVLDYNN